MWSWYVPLSSSSTFSQVQNQKIHQDIFHLFFHFNRENWIRLFFYYNFFDFVYKCWSKENLHQKCLFMLDEWLNFSNFSFPLCFLLNKKKIIIKWRVMVIFRRYWKLIIFIYKKKKKKDLLPWNEVKKAELFLLHFMTRVYKWRLNKKTVVSWLIFKGICGLSKRERKKGFVRLYFFDTNDKNFFFLQEWIYIFLYTRFDGHHKNTKLYF